MAEFNPGRAKTLFAIAEDIIGNRVAPLTFELDLALARVAQLEDENQRLEGQWLDGGSHPEDIEAGTRVHYHPIRGESEYRAGATRGKPGLNASGLWLVHVDLDDGKTICSAHIRHLRREPEEERLRARVAVLEKLKSQRNLEVCIAKTERDNLQARVSELEGQFASQDMGLSYKLTKENIELIARVTVLEKAARKLCNTPPGDWELTCNGQAFNELDALLPGQSGEVVS